jgi:N-acyl amino acid synthase of PEP-CTERM/exosortase system
LNVGTCDISVEQDTGVQRLNKKPRSSSTVEALSSFRVDHMPELLVGCYRLRYQVYCIERAFLSPTNYRDEIEVDEFDRHAWHFATVDSFGNVLATARLVLPSILGLPMFRHCKIFPDEHEPYDPAHSVVEVSRLSMSRQVRAPGSRLAQSGSVTGSTGLRDAVTYSLYRALYHESKRAGFTHWLVATEASLQRAVRAYAFPFRPIGPPIDYFGPVTPYLMNLSVFDRVVLAGTKPRLNGFLDGLEHRYHPRAMMPTLA